MTYNGLSISATKITTGNAFTQTTSQLKNSQNQLVRSTDAIGGYNRYVYDPFGNLLATVDAAGNITTMSYDLRGRKREMVDPDLGHWVYGYDVLGQLTYQRDALNQVVTMQYDLLGRLTQRTEAEGVSSWDYDGTAAEHNIGKLVWAYGPNNYTRHHYYDGFGRLYYTVTTPVTGVSFNESTQFDTLGRVAGLTYPNGFAVINTYNSLGFLTDITGTDPATPTVTTHYWHLTALDADGQLTQAVLGNGLTTLRSYDSVGRIKTISTGLGSGSGVQALSYGFDTLGNLRGRNDRNQHYSEVFGYDALNRLTSSTLYGTLDGTASGTAYQDSRTYTYDSLGNLTSKSDIGTYTYGAGNAGPHAVTSTSGGPHSASYTYDANGNQRSGDGRTLHYTSFSVPDVVSKTGYSSTFSFDPEHARTRQVEKQTGQPDQTTYYLHPRPDAGAHVEYVVGAGVAQLKSFIYAGSLLVAQYTSRNNATRETRYFHTDHLGSIDTITDETGQVLAGDEGRLSYDAFGKRRHSNGQSDPSNSLRNSVTDYGFTTQEHLDEVGLIHLNGRVYDPGLGRFLSADPTIQHPDTTQGFNRYSYVENNPLRFSDPTGFGFVDDVFSFLSENIGLVLAVAFALTPAGPLSLALFEGFATGLVSGGTLKSGIIGAITAGAFHYVGGASALGDAGSPGEVLAHGLVGGLSNVAQGQSFGQGFVSAAVPEAFAPGIEKLGRDGDPGFGRVERTVAAAILGGTSSVLGGGKFQNGAITGAFGRFFNDESDGSGASNMRPQNSNLFTDIDRFVSGAIDEIIFGFNAVVGGVTEDYRNGGVASAIVGATGGRTDQNFVEQIAGNYRSTSIVFGPIRVDKTLASLTVAGAVTRSYGGYTLGQYIMRGVAPHLGTNAATLRLVAGTSAINSVIIGGAYEVGNGFGSFARAVINRAARAFEQ